MQSHRERQQIALNNKDNLIQAVANAFPLQKEDGFEAIYPFFISESENGRSSFTYHTDCWIESLLILL